MFCLGCFFSFFQCLAGTAEYSFSGTDFPLCFVLFIQSQVKLHSTTNPVYLSHVMSHSTPSGNLMKVMKIVYCPFYQSISHKFAPTPHGTLSLRSTEATLFCRLSHRWFPSCTMVFSLHAASVRFSRARRRYCLLTSSSWVRRSLTCRWNVCSDSVRMINAAFYRYP